MTHDIRYRRLELADLQRYLDCRLSSLREAPSAFLVSHDEEAVRGPKLFGRLLSENSVDRQIFGAFLSEQLIGVVGLRRDQRPKINHRAMLWGMYVRPAMRGRGVGAELLERLVQYAKQVVGVRVVYLSVTASNASALRLYETAGFQQWGVEPDAMRVDGRSLDEVHMSRRL